MAQAAITTKPKPAKQEPLELTPEMERFVVVKLGRPANLWRWLNRVHAWVNGTVSRDQWDLAYDLARKAVDGKPLHPEDAAMRVQRMIAAQLSVPDDEVAAAVAKDEASDIGVLVAYWGLPSKAFFHSRAITLKEPGKRNG